MTKLLRGYFPIMPTAFDDSGQIDLTSIRRLVNFLVENGAHGMSPNGGDSECRYLVADERKRITDAVVEENSGRLPVLVGTSSKSTEESVDLSHYAAKAGADAVFVKPPSDREDVSDDEMFAHYATIANATDITIMIHATGNMTVELVRRLIEGIPTVKYIKEETSFGPKLTTYIRALSNLITVFGPGHQYITELARGIQGVMPSCCAPTTHARIFDLWQEGNHGKARSEWHRLLPLVHWRWQSSPHEAGKEYLKHMGVFSTSYSRSIEGKKLLEEYSLREMLEILEWKGSPY